MTPEDEWESIQKRLRDFAEGHGERFAANLKAIREGMRAARGKPSTIPAELDVRGEEWPAGEATTITVDELLKG